MIELYVRVCNQRYMIPLGALKDLEVWFVDVFWYFTPRLQVYQDTCHHLGRAFYLIEVCIYSIQFLFVFLIVGIYFDVIELIISIGFIIKRL